MTMVNAHAASDGADVTIRSALGLELGDGAGVRVAWGVWMYGMYGVYGVYGMYGMYEIYGCACLYGVYGVYDVRVVLCTCAPGRICGTIFLNNGQGISFFPYNHYYCRRGHGNVVRINDNIR